MKISNAEVGKIEYYYTEVKIGSEETATKSITVCESHSVRFDSLQPHGLYTVHGILQARILEWAAVPISRGSSQPGIEPRSPALQVDSLPVEPPRKPKNPGVGSLSLLQGIFPTQESNKGLLHSRGFFTS